MEFLEKPKFKEEISDFNSDKLFWVGFCNGLDTFSDSKQLALNHLNIKGWNLSNF